MSIKPRIMLFLVFAVLLSGCAGISGKLSPPVEPVATGEFRAGAAKVDITPMPGYPMGGYAVAGQISRGVWARLYARAFCFEDEKGRAMALVSADLWAMPAGLCDRIAELVARDYGIRQLSREQMVLAATHTHTGPANYSSCKLYNQMASKEGGFDRDFFDFLASSIAGVIADAWNARRPAVVRYSEAPLPGIARNRSLGPFRMNGPEAQALIDENRDLPIRATNFPVGDDDAYRAIDQTLRVLLVEAAGGIPSTIAVLAFYAVHPTVMNTTTQVYSSDIFGVAAGRVEKMLEVKAYGKRSPVVAVFNGPEGDVAANWQRRDREETLELGGMLACGIEDLIGGPGREVTGDIAFNFSYSDLCKLADPFSGASTLCGAEADWAFLRDAGFYEGMTQDDPEKQYEGQAEKRNPLEDDIRSDAVKALYPWFVKNVMKPPRSVPIGVYRIGPVAMATLPGEFTTILGRRIAGAIRRELPDADAVLLVGLANEYMSYFCTREEYAAQHYEGASMMYGPMAGNLIQDDLAALARDMGKAPLREKKQGYRYSTGSGKKFGVKQFDLISHQDRLVANHYNLVEVLMDRGSGLAVSDYPRFIWIDSNPGWSKDPESQRPVAPCVAIEMKTGGGWIPLEIGGAPENDEGFDFVTVIVASLLGNTRWTTIWMPPFSGGGDPALIDSEFRFVVEGTSGTFRSPAFTLGSARERSGLTGIARKPEKAGKDGPEKARSASGSL